jgi:hypothetical protein
MLSATRRRQTAVSENGAALASLNGGQDHDEAMDTWPI